MRLVAWVDAPKGARVEGASELFGNVETPEKLWKLVRRRKLSGSQQVWELTDRERHNFTFTLVA